MLFAHVRRASACCGKQASVVENMNLREVNYYLADDSESMKTDQRIPVNCSSGDFPFCIKYNADS